MKKIKLELEILVEDELDPKNITVEEDGVVDGFVITQKQTHPDSEEEEFLMHEAKIVSARNIVAGTSDLGTLVFEIDKAEVKESYVDDRVNFIIIDKDVETLKLLELAQNKDSLNEMMEQAKVTAKLSFPVGTRIICTEESDELAGVKGYIIEVRVLDEKETENEGVYEFVCCLEPTEEQEEAINQEFSELEFGFAFDEVILNEFMLEADL